jgi:hypothetical protein
MKTKETTKNSKLTGRKISELESIYKPVHSQGLIIS